MKIIVLFDNYKIINFHLLLAYIHVCHLFGTASRSKFAPDEFVSECAYPLYSTPKYAIRLSVKRSHRMAMTVFLDCALEVFEHTHAALPCATPLWGGFQPCKSAVLGSSSRSSTSCGRNTCTSMCIVLLRFTSYIHVIVPICLKRVNRHGWCECRFCMEQKTCLLRNLGLFHQNLILMFFQFININDRN